MEIIEVMLAKIVQLIRDDSEDGFYLRYQGDICGTLAESLA